MDDKKRLYEIIELIKIWHYIRSSNLVWPKVLSVLEDKINEMTDL